MYQRTSFAVSLLVASAAAQQIGTYDIEVHPLLPSQYCTQSGCEAQNTSIVLDVLYRWLHTVDGYEDCKLESGEFDPTLCPDPETCAANCAVEGVDYSSYGISTSDDSLTLNLFSEDGTSASSPRVYLLGDSDSYVNFQLLNREFTYDVDVSKLPCGVNGALHFSEMSADGDSSELNQAGAAYGTGYCDAQCPDNEWVAGQANINGTYGACCNEMDIWEANSLVTAFTPHPCDSMNTRLCSGDECYEVCDSPGCDFNPYRNGQQEFYGPNKTVDSTRRMTVVTQFFTEGDQDNGTLSRIERLYIQDGQVIENIHVDIEGFPSKYNFMDDEYCETQADVFNSGDGFVFDDLGGMKQMGEALQRGMVLVMSIWMSDDGMLWLDGSEGDSSSQGNLRGPCTAEEEELEFIQEHFPDASVSFSNIKWGEIGTTYQS